MRQSNLSERIANRAFVSTLGFGFVLIAGLSFSMAPVADAFVTSQLESAAERATAIDGTTDPEQIVEALTAPGFGIAVTPLEEEADSSGQVNFDGNSDVATIEVVLPKSGVLVTLSQSNELSGYLGWAVLGVGSGILAVLALAVRLVQIKLVRREAEPLNSISALAQEVAQGTRGDRLNLNSKAAEDLRQTATALNSMLDALEASENSALRNSKRIEELAQDVAHELKTPLANLIALADNGIRQSDSEDEQIRLSNLVREASRAARIVDDLTLAIGSPAAAQQLTKAELGELLEELGGEFPTAVFTGSNRLKIAMDAGQLLQILRNLLSNATRYGSGAIRLDVSDQGDSVVIGVEDDGPGVAPEDRDRIFERFVRLDYARARIEGGAGLGLAISRQLAEQAGGSLHCVNPHHLGGARFELKASLSE